MTLLWAALLNSAAAQEPAARPRQVAFDRTERCLTCHSNLKSGTDFVSNMSAKTWQEDDKHSRAFVLLEEQSPLTERILGFPLSEVVRDGVLRDEGVDPERRQAVEKCLRCHATWPKGEVQPPVELRLGVSCQACHGPGFHWSRPHEEKWWRLCSAAEKERLGMRNLRDVSVKAALCTSCHVGSADEDRQVTHAMYAAGHPPLPGFELAAFAVQMPAHWRTLAAKGAFVGSPAAPYQLTAQDRLTLQQLPVDPAALQADYRAAHYPDWDHDPAADHVPTREILAGGVAVLRRYVEQVAAEAGRRQTGIASWPDFALYDCRSCHHELRAGSNAGERGARRAPPGRPPAMAWATVLARVAAGQAAAGQDPAVAAQGVARFDGHWQALERAVYQRPFGDAAGMRAAADELQKYLDELARQVARGRWDDAAARRLARDLLNDPSGADGTRPSVDFQAARQLGWSLEVLLGEPPLGRAQGEIAAPWPRYLVADEGHDPLRLRLPAGTRASVTGQLPAALDALADYDPAWLVRRLATLRQEFLKNQD